MRRFTRSAAVLLLAASLAACSSAPPVPVQHESGVFGALEPIILDNLTLPDGRYELTVELELFVDVPRPTQVTCAVVDTSARLGPLLGMGIAVTPGRWIDTTAVTVVELPDITLGLRCYPNERTAVDVLIREATLNAVQQF